QDLRLNYVLNDTLRIHIERKLSRKIALRIDTTTIRLAPDHRITSPISISPDSIVVSGPTSMIKSIPSPHIFPLDTNKNWSKDYQDVLPLFQELSPLIQVETEEARVFFSIDKFERRDIMIPLEKLNFPPGQKVVLSDSLIHISFTVRTADIPYISVESFTVVVDYQRRSKKEKTIIPELLYYPNEYISELEMHPMEIEVKR
ncbi:MAG: hypothetical protein OXB93_00270, partial [Cytophagales bacterium]|nr:hypothetical protein [Cytophagales bacterium]